MNMSALTLLCVSAILVALTPSALSVRHEVSAKMNMDGTCDCVAEMDSGGFTDTASTRPPANPECKNDNGLPTNGAGNSGSGNTGCENEGCTALIGLVAELQSHVAELSARLSQMEAGWCNL